MRKVIILQIGGEIKFYITLDERKVCTIDDRIPKTTGRLYAGIKYIA